MSNGFHCIRETRKPIDWHLPFRAARCLYPWGARISFVLLNKPSPIIVAANFPSTFLPPYHPSFLYANFHHAAFRQNGFRSFCILPAAEEEHWQACKRSVTRFQQLLCLGRPMVEELPVKRIYEGLYSEQTSYPSPQWLIQTLFQTSQLLHITAHLLPKCSISNSNK